VEKPDLSIWRVMRFGGCVQVFLDALSHVVGQVQSKQLLMQHCLNSQQTGRLQLLGMLLGVSEWTKTFDGRTTFPPSCVEEVTDELENAIEVSVVVSCLPFVEVARHHYLYKFFTK